MFDRSQYEPKNVVLATLRAIVRTLDPRLLTAAAAVTLVDWFAEIERLAAAGKAIAAGRVAECGAWKASGARSAADWLATRTGSTVSEARGALDTAARLDAAPGTDAALRGGELSMRQAEAVAAAAAADPDAEARLLDMARTHALQKLRDESERVRAAADPDPEARRKRIHRGRFWRRSDGPDGSRRGSYSMTPEDAALFEAAAQPFIDARIDQARRDGETEPSDAYALDGLLAMGLSTRHRADDEPEGADVGDTDADTDSDTDTDADASGGCGPDAPTPPRPSRGGRGRRRLGRRRELIGIVNLESLMRGSVGPGETCEIAGIGPISLEAARSIFGDALLRIVIRDGVDIRTVVHTGRTASAVQETAILVRQDGRCAVATCGLGISEIDHQIDFPVGGAAPLDGLAGLCGHHHDRKTRDGFTYRREPDGTFTWIHPDGVEEHERPPPVTARS